MTIKQAFGKYVTLNVLGMLGLSCYILADTFFIAQGVGSGGLTALNLAIPIYSFIHGVGLMIGMGGATRYALAKGAKSQEYHSIFTHSLIYATLWAVFFLGNGLFFAPMIANSFGVDQGVTAMTESYLRVILCGAPGFLLNNLVICFVRNDGNPHLAMAGMLVGSLSNVVLDYLFVFPLGMGILGAAIATAMAPLISLAVLSAHFLRKKNQFYLSKIKLNLRKFADISALGSGSLITEVSSGLVIMAFNGIILNLEGSIGVAAYGVIANCSLVIFSVLTGIAQGVQPLISSLYGAGDKALAKKVLHYATTTALGFSALIYLVILAFSGAVVGVFNPENNPQLTQIATNGMAIYFTAFVFAGVNMMRFTYYSGIDQAVKGFKISILRGFVVILPMAYGLTFFLGMNGLWAALPTTEALVMVLTGSRESFSRNKLPTKKQV